MQDAADCDASLAACLPPAAAGTAWSGSAGPIVITDDRSRSGPAEESSGSLQLFLRLSTFTALPWKHCKQHLYGYAISVGPIRPACPAVANRVRFAALTRLRGL